MVTPSYAVSERAQRRNEVSQKAFLLTFFSEKSKLALLEDGSNALAAADAQSSQT